MSARTRSSIRDRWRSALSWIRWSKRRKQRRALEQRRVQDSLLLEIDRIQERHHRELERQVAILLLESLRPLAAALKRQDDLLIDRTEALKQLLSMQHEQVEMLAEVLELEKEALNSLQPSPEDSLLRRTSMI